MSLSYRFHEPSDFHAIEQLWRENTDWGPLTEQMWQRVLTKGKLGGLSILLATDNRDGQVMGAFAFIPSIVSVDGREILAFRPGMPIVSKSHRYLGLNPLAHPILVMFREALKAMKERGDGLVYMVPDPHWVRLLRLNRELRCGSFPLWSKRLPLAEPLPPTPGYSTVPIDLKDPRIDELWGQASRLHGCSVVRDTRSLIWKLGFHDDVIFGVERAGELKALVASRQKGGKQWLVSDMLFADADDSLRAALSAVVNLAHGRSMAADPTSPIEKVAILATACMEPAVKELGFYRDQYDLPFAVQVLDPTLSREELDPARWYVSAND